MIKIWTIRKYLQDSDKPFVVAENHVMDIQEADEIEVVEKLHLDFCTAQQQILRDSLKEAKELVSDMILAVHMPAKMARWPEISARALKLLEGETNGKQEESKAKGLEETNKEVQQKTGGEPG